MTTSAFDSKDTEVAYSRFAHDYEPDAINNAIQSLHLIGYTQVAPFINDSHVKACDEILDAFEVREESTGKSASNDEVISMSVLALTHMKRLEDIVVIVSQRHVSSSKEAESILKIIKKVSEPIR